MKKTLTLGIVFVLLLSTFSLFSNFSSANAVTSLSTWCAAPPNIDGVLSMGEWTAASYLPFVIGSTYTGTFYVMNDGTNLYIAVSIQDSTRNDGDQINVLFDNNNNGVGPEIGDDIVNSVGGTSGWGLDSFWAGSSYGAMPDIDPRFGGGTDDVQASAGWQSGVRTFELSHPLSSGDVSHDFSLSIGQTVGFNMQYVDNGIGVGTIFPFGSYEDIVIAHATGNIPLLMPGIKIQADGTDLRIDDVATSALSTFVVDWNNDGRKDLLLGTYSPGYVYLFLNTGSDSAPTFGTGARIKEDGTDLQVFQGANPFVVDWNSDGKKDLLMSSMGIIYLYINIGTDSAPLFSSASKTTLLQANTPWPQPFVVDWNNDGKKDLLVGHSGISDQAYIDLYINIGTDAFPVFGNPTYIQATGVPISRSYGSSPFVVDWNNDGKKDLLVREGTVYGSSRGPLITYYENIGTDAIPSFNVGITVQAAGQNIAVNVGDGSRMLFVTHWNNDGLWDIVIGDYGGYVWLYSGVANQKRTWIVDDDGPADFASIQDAINSASEGDTVFVKNGVYTGCVVVDKAVKLEGEDRELTVIRGDNFGKVIHVGASNVVVENFALMSDYEYPHQMGNWDDATIIISHADNVEIRNNVFSNWYLAIWCEYSNDNIVQGNQFSESIYGIDFYYTQRSTIESNILDGSTIWMYETYDSLIKSNVLENAERHLQGIYVYRSCNNAITENIIKNTEYGVTFYWYSHDNVIYHNNFVDNTIQVSLWGDAVFNTFDSGYPAGGNYWSDYTGIDSNKDGIGDTLYLIDANNLDHYPLMEPWLHGSTGSAISIGVWPNSVKLGGSLTISGAISPVHNAEVTLTYTRSDSTTVVRTVTSDSTGYIDEFVPDAVGSWSVKSSWDGDVEHTAAASSTLGFTVQPSDIAGIENVVSFISYKTVEDNAFSIQQNFLITDYSGNHEYWAQNIIKVYPKEGKMSAAFEIFDTKNQPPWPIPWIPSALWFTSVEFTSKATVTLRSTLENNHLIMENDFYSYVWNHELTSDYFIELSHEIVVVGENTGNSPASFLPSTTGHVDTYVKMGSNPGIWLYGRNSVIQPPTTLHANTLEESAGLNWETSGTFQDQTDGEDQGLWVTPDLNRRSASPPEVPQAPEYPPEGIIINLQCPANLNLYDSLGRHIGITTADLVEMRIPNAVYSFSDGEESITIFSPSGDYVLQVVGTGDGSYTLETIWRDKTGQEHDMGTFSGSITQSAKDSYAIVVPSTGEPVVIADNKPPSARIESPTAGWALQGVVTLTSSATDADSGVAYVNFTIREDNGGAGKPVGFEDIRATYDPEIDKWQINFNTLQLPDGYYKATVEAVDNVGNIGSTTVSYSIRNWAVLRLQPQTVSNKAGRTMPIKFSLRVDSAADPTQPFLYSEELTIKIYATSKPNTILQQSTFGAKSKDYRIDTTNKLYITNFQTSNAPTQYTAAIYRGTLLIGSFTFSTTK